MVLHRGKGQHNRSSPAEPLERKVQGSAAQEDSVMIKQGNAAKAERGGSGGDPRPSRFSPGLPGDQAETRSQQAFRGLLRNVLDAERCLEAVPHPFVRSAGRKHGDSSRRVLDPEPSRLLGDAARQRAESHRHDRKPETRRLPACARQDRASATQQPTMTCLVHLIDSVQGLHRTKKSSRRVTFLRATPPGKRCARDQSAESACACGIRHRFGGPPRKTRRRVWHKAQTT